jgi:acyl-CoA thioester hydrolase
VTSPAICGSVNEFFDSAVNGWLIGAAGVDVRELPAIGVVAETSCRYLREISFPGDVSVGLALLRLGTSSVVYQLGVFAYDGGDLDSRPRAVGRFVHVYVDAWTRRPAPVPEPVRSALAALQRPA